MPTEDQIKGAYAAGYADGRNDAEGQDEELQSENDELATSLLISRKKHELSIEQVERLGDALHKIAEFPSNEGRIARLALAEGRTEALDKLAELDADLIGDEDE